MASLTVLGDPLRLPLGDPARRDRTVTVPVDAIVDTARGDTLTPPELARRLATAGIVFVGEEHTSAEFHAVQLRVIRALHEAGRPVLIGVEMFPYPAQAVLDDWVAGRLTEDAFLATADWYAQWGYHWQYYRDIFWYAREQGLRLVALNSPREAVRRVRQSGLDALTAAERAQLPPTLAPVTPEYQQLFRAYFSPDDALHLKPAALEGLYRAQTLWDATMGWQAVLALRADRRPEAVIVVLIGAGHVTYGLGAERQIAPHYPGRVASVVPVPAGTAAPATVQASYADYVWGLPPPGPPAYPSLGVSLLGTLGAEPGRVIQVAPDSPAARAGLKVDDRLLAAGGLPVDSEVALRRALHPLRWGDTLTVRVLRGGAEQTLEVPLRR